MIPTNLKFTHEHEWILIEEDIATVGISDSNDLTCMNTIDLDRF